MLKMFRKSILVVLVLSLFTVITSKTYGQSAPKVSVSVSKRSFNPGESGVLTIKFKTGSQVKIPKEPPIDVSVSGVNGDGLQDYSGGEGDYLSNNQVKYNFTVPGDAESGSSITIQGSVKFGYCSTESGVCKIGKQNFSVKIKVK